MARADGGSFSLLSGLGLLLMLICNSCATASRSEPAINITVHQKTRHLVVTTPLNGTCNETTPKIWKKMQINDTEYVDSYNFDACKPYKECLSKNLNSDIAIIYEGRVVDKFVLEEVKYNDSIPKKWSQEGNNSMMRVKSSPPFVAAMSLTLSPQNKESSDSKFSSERCDQTETTDVEGILNKEHDHFEFTVDWHELDIHCEYSCKIVEKNFCEKPFNDFTVSSLLSYEKPTQSPPLDQQQDEGATLNKDMVIVIIVMVAVIAVLMVMFLLLSRQNRKRTRERRHQEIGEKSPFIYKKRTTVLMLYASDVSDKVADFMDHLRRSTNCEILDLHDDRNSHKMSDPSVWLLHKLHDPDTRTLLVASRMAKSYSISSASPPVLGGKEGEKEGQVRENKREKAEEDEKERNKKNEEQMEEKPLDFLLRYALETLRDTKLCRDYSHVYQILFDDIPYHELLDYVTPGRFYILPQQEQILFHDLTSSQSLQYSSEVISSAEEV